jgi:hypothetical protein
MTDRLAVRPGTIATVSFATAGAAFLFWSIAIFFGPSNHWEAWDQAIHAVWIIIPIALILGLVTAAISAFAPSATGAQDRWRGIRLVLIGLGAIAIVAWIVAGFTLR